MRIAYQTVSVSLLLRARLAKFRERPTRLLPKRPMRVTRWTRSPTLWQISRRRLTYTGRSRLSGRMASAASDPPPPRFGCGAEEWKSELRMPAETSEMRSASVPPSNRKKPPASCGSLDSIFMSSGCGTSRTVTFPDAASSVTVAVCPSRKESSPRSAPLWRMAMCFRGAPTRSRFLMAMSPLVTRKTLPTFSPSTMRRSPARRCRALPALRKKRSIMSLLMLASSATDDCSAPMAAQRARRRSSTTGWRTSKFFRVRSFRGVGPRNFAHRFG
mmetsp:Transcript_35578/g.93377  ORF Transcript_35578/g.93377 Transcript_35578/m.93377 type:complete len:273 (+) Transcript_35578:472-1290(+)